MRIAYVTSEYITECEGGLANYLHRVALTLKKVGHEPVIITLSNKNETIIHKGIEVHKISPKKRDKFLFKLFMGTNYDKTLWLSWVLYQALRRIHKAKPLDLVQYPNCGNLGYFRLKDIPNVLRYSSLYKYWYAPYIKLDQRTIQKKIQLEENIIKKMYKVFGPSKLMGSIIEQELGVPTTIIETPFLFEISDYDYSLYDDCLKDKKYLLFFGRISELKGADTIAEIIFNLLDQYKDLYFVFAGQNSPYKETTSISYIIHKAGKHSDRVLHFKNIRHGQLYPIVEKAQAIVLPSKIDNIPNTCLESMAHRKVVIGTKGASFEQLITDGYNGLLCEIDNPVSLYNKIISFLSMSDREKCQIGERAFETTQRLKPEITVKILLDFYQKTINEYNNSNKKGL